MTSKKSDVAVIEALKKTGGNVTLSAKMLGIEGRSLRKRIERNPALAEVRDEQRDSLLDIAEHNIRNAILNKSVEDSWKLLRTLGRKRGYVEKEEVEQVGGITVVVRDIDTKL